MGMQFYNANGVLTTGTKNCTGPADCTTDGEVGCVATSAVPGALATNLSPGDIRSGQTIGGVTGNLVLPSVVAVASGQQYGAGGPNSLVQLQICLWLVRLMLKKVV